jgi:CMP-N-acetylneuraminic acid synthetase
MSVVAFIFARGGSKGLPGKNIRPLNGKPLIGWSIEHALSVKRIDRVIVSTDSETIADVARHYGAEVPFLRPAEFASDESPEWLAWRHALTYLIETAGALPDVMVSVPVTAPLRQSIDVENCLDEYEKGDVDVVITVTEAHRNPYFNMVKLNKDGSVVLVNPPQTTVVRRQDAPVVYDIATVCYVLNPKFVMTHDSIFSGVVKAVEVPTERAIDIDTLLDFQIAEAILNFNNPSLYNLK